MPDRVVVATHEVTRTGAPMSLLHLLRWLVAETDLEVTVVVAGPGKDGGQLLGEFEAVAPTVVAPELFAVDGTATLPPCDVLYVNSVFAAGCLRPLPAPPPYVISRVPELSMAIRQLTDADGRTELFERTDRYVAVSQAVRRVLIDEHGVDEGAIAVVPGAVDLEAVAPPSAADVAARRAELGVPADGFLVGGAGTTDWRKGPDLFVRVAMAVAERLGGPSAHFAWLGGEAGGPAFWRAENRVRTGNAPPVHFLGSRPDPFAWFGALDLFALTSREDPFPRVVMENAALGVPVVTFDNGGAPELVAKGCGVTVAYLDVEAMADAIVGLLRDPGRRAELGARGREVVRAEHTVETGGPATLAEIERGLARAGTR